MKGKTERLELIESLENKSAREVQRKLLTNSSNPAKIAPEKVRPVSPTHTELKLVVEDKLLEKIDELKNLLAHANPSASTAEILELAIDAKLLELKKKTTPRTEEKTLNNSTEPLPTSAVETADTGKSPSRYIPRGVKREVWKRDKGQCTYAHNGKRCCSKRALEVDHVIPYAVGGINEAGNLRLMCKAHNQLGAIGAFGKEKMARYLPRLR